MIRTLRYLTAASTLAAALGFWGWAAAAILFTLAGDALFFDISTVLAGAALLAGILALAFWAGLSVARAERNMQEVLDRLPALPTAGPYVRDDSARLTAAALARARRPRLVVDNRARS